MLGFTFFLGLIFDGFDKYEEVSDYELEVIIDLPRFDTWEGAKSHDGGDILRIQVRAMLSSFLTKLLKI